MTKTETIVATGTEAAKRRNDEPPRDKAHGTVTPEIVAMLRKAAPDSEPSWIKQRRNDAVELVETFGMPHPRLESFRKTDLGPLRSQVWPLAAPGAVAAEQLEPYVIPDCIDLLLVDGHFAPEQSTTDLPDGVRVASLREAIANDDPIVERHLGTVVQHTGPEETLRAMNTAAFQDGILVHVAADTQVDRPLRIIMATNRHEAPATVFPRVLVVAEAGAKVTVIEHTIGLGQTAHVGLVSEFVAAPNSHVTHVKVQDEPAEHIHTYAWGAAVGRDATFTDLAASFGAARSRNDHVARLDQGSTVHLDGLFVARDSQLVDHHTWIDHAQPHATSLQRYKGILDGKAHGVFTGNVLVRQDAQQTASEQENRNLILSREATVDTTPQLEIHADDVKCAHGSTIGRLPENQVFYLRSRGLDEQDARRVLTEAFAAEVLDRIEAGSLRTWLEERLRAWFLDRPTEATA